MRTHVCAGLSAAMLAALAFATLPSAASSSATSAVASSPSKAAAQFFRAWKDRDFKAMYQATSYGWRRNNSLRTLRAQYDFKYVSSWKIVKVSRAEFSTDVTVNVDYRAFSKKRPMTKVRIRARVLKEDKSGRPSSSGKWGVNATSTLREVTR